MRRRPIFLAAVCLPLVVLLIALREGPGVRAFSPLQILERPAVREIPPARLGEEASGNGQTAVLPPAGPITPGLEMPTLSPLPPITATLEMTWPVRPRALDPALLPHPPEMEALPPYSAYPGTDGTIVCGAIETDTVWTVDLSPYQVVCDISVSASVALTVEAGVLVQFEHADDDLIVAGALQAVGTEDAAIRFQPLSGTAPGSWGQVALLVGSSGVLDHAVLEYGGSSDGLLYVASDAVQVLSSVVQHGANFGVVIQAASPLISATQILSNTGFWGGGLYNDSGSPTIQYNTISGNAAPWSPSSGVSDELGGGLYNGSGSPIIQHNTFSGNLGFGFGGGLYNDSGHPTIQYNTFSTNSARNNAGGGLYNAVGNPIIEKNTFSDNVACWGAGGLYNDSGNPTIRDNTFIGNWVHPDTGGGGG